MYIQRKVIASRNSVTINTSIALCISQILFMHTFVIDTTSIYTIKRSAYMSYSYNDQQSLKSHTNITSKDPFLKFMTSSMIKVMYIFYTQLFIRHNTTFDFVM